jgi:hypothetical protein
MQSTRARVCVCVLETDVLGMAGSMEVGTKRSQAARSHM